MSSQTRTFALQAAAVAVVVGIIFFAFLRPSDVGELSGIQAPNGEEPFATPNNGHQGKQGSKRGRADSGRQRAQGATMLVRTGFGPGGGSTGPFVGEAPADAQYAGTAAALAAQVEGPPVTVARISGAVPAKAGR